MEYDRYTSPPSNPNSSTLTTTTPNSSPPDIAADNMSSSMYHSIFQATEQRLNQARMVLEHQQLCDHYDLCISRLKEFTGEMETLRRENADLRLANSALLKLFSSFDYLNKEISSAGFSPKSVMDPKQFENVNYSLPKNISVPTTHYVKPNQTNTYTDLIRRRLEKREEEEKAEEMEMYNQGMWKTEICNKWEQTGTCPYGVNCQFAHGITELRSVMRHPKYKTQLCRMILYGDKCPYGHRCHFRHSLNHHDRSSLSLSLDQTDRKPKPKTKESSCRLPPFRHREHRQFCLSPPPPSSLPTHSCPVRSEIGKTWHLLPIEERAKFGQAADGAVAARNISGEQPHHESFVIPNNSDFPLTDEEIPGTTNHLGYKAEAINTRCTPSQWCQIVKKLFEEQKQAVHALGFGNLLALDCGRLRLKICRWLVDNFDTKASSINIHGRRFVLNSSIFALVLGILDLGDQIFISGDVPNLDFWKSKFPIISRGIFLKDIEHSLEEMTTTDDEFKLFYLHTLQWDPPIVDKTVFPVVYWTNVKIKKYVFRLHTEGGVGSNQISVEEFFKQPTQSNGQYNCVAHGETSQANQVPVTGNHAHMKGIDDVLQLVKEIQSTMKTELVDIRTKVNFLYDKFSSAEDKNPDNNLHNTSSHYNSMHNIPRNPTPPPPSSLPLSNPTSQHPTIEVSSNNTRTLPQHEQTIYKSTPSWMKAPSEPPLEDGNAPDLPLEDLHNDDPYYVPPVLTVPSLVDEDEQESQSSNK
ncbi:hypothetical protein LWI28_028605 [Acer negundo]|uniref:C3H1-type domain-containing protein n=1 Tax=Acer negundo TaxID=4023 RepID=A0AAD5IGZ5_ACENE|nr:hypothetical protein LWI28_028605 [Acer negundo]